MNYIGLIIAIGTFLLIGVFHPIVIKAEYYFSSKVWPVFLVFGILCVIGSIFITNVIGSAFLGVTGCSFLWSIGELKEQEKRVEKGWFPNNLNRK